MHRDGVFDVLIAVTGGKTEAIQMVLACNVRNVAKHHVSVGA